MALLTQSGTGAPIVDVLENELSALIAWTRPSGAGSYTGTLVGAFPFESKTAVIIGVLNTADSLVVGGWGDVNSVYLTSFLATTNTDGLLYKTPIEIRVYN